MAERSGVGYTGMMKTCVRGGAGAAIALLAAGVGYGQHMDLISQEPVSYGLISGGSFIQAEDLGIYSRQPELFAGHQRVGADAYRHIRGYMVFDVPHSGGIQRPEDWGLDPAEIGADEILVKISDLSLTIDTVSFSQMPVRDLTMQLSLSNAAPALLLGGSDPSQTQDLYHDLGTPAIVAEHTFSAATSPASGSIEDFTLPLNAVMRDRVAEFPGGLFVLSFNVVFSPGEIESRQFLSLSDWEDAITINGTASYYFVPVPEPSTYGVAAAVLLGGAVWWRRRGARGVES